MAIMSDEQMDELKQMLENRLGGYGVAVEIGGAVIFVDGWPVMSEVEAEEYSSGFLDGWQKREGRLREAREILDTLSDLPVLGDRQRYLVILDTLRELLA